MTPSIVNHRGEALRELYEYVIVDRNIAVDELTLGHVIDLLQEEGLYFWRDARFGPSLDVAVQMIGEDRETISNHLIDYSGFVNFVSPLAFLFLRAFSEDLVIPDWSSFVSHMTYHFYGVKDIKDGQNAQYIPILRDADPERWGLSICSIDGQRFSIGDYEEKFGIQSVSKPVTYGLCLKQEGEEEVSRWIGVEPAGRPFNTQDLDADSQCPFNASVNSGAIMAAGLFASAYPESTWEECVDKIRQTWQDMSGNDVEVGFSQESFDSEKATAFNNFAIAYNLKGRRNLPRNVDLLKMLDVYLGCCSIEMTVEAMAVAAATLANGGVCPITFKEVFPADVVRQVLSETMMCGMYDQAGRFAVEVGLPAKSGVAGAIMVIAPNVCGFATFSPRLNKQGNSARGLAFFKSVVGSYRFHIFESLRSSNSGDKIDPRTNGYRDERINSSQLVWAYQAGDVWATRLRTVFLYMMVMCAAVSKEGLSDRKKQAILDNYELVYQSTLDEESLHDAIAKVGVDPHDMGPLRALKGYYVVPDAFCTVMLTAAVEIIIVDGQVDVDERNFAVELYRFCGMDQSAAMMEVDRLEHQVGHHFKNVDPCDSDCQAKIGMLESLAVPLEPSLLEGPLKGGGMHMDPAEEVLLLRREVHRLQARVSKLTHMLHESQQERTRRLSLRKSSSTNLAATLQDTKLEE